MAPSHSGLWRRYALRHPLLAVFAILAVVDPRNPARHEVDLYGVRAGG